MHSFPLCHIKTATGPEAFLERLARAGCGGVLVEVRLEKDNPRDIHEMQRLCRKFDLPFWLMPVVDEPAAKYQAWMLDISKGAPQPAKRTDVFNVLQEASADFLFDQLKRYYDAPPDGVFVQTSFAPVREPFPWTPDFEKYFWEQHGYQFQEKWHCLTATSGADDAMVRQHYWETVNARMQAFVEQCAQRALAAKSTFRHNLMAPEIAALSLPRRIMQRRRAAQSIEIIAFEDWPQLLYQTFDCSINGAVHLAVTLPENFDEKPAAQYFAIARNAAAHFMEGHNAARVGMLFPLRSARTHYHPDSHRYPRWVGEDVSRMSDYLNTMHYDYRLVEENELKNPPCELLIIASATAISTEAWDDIEAWIKRGGKVACAGLLPRWSERGRDAELEDRISRATKQTLQDVYDGYLAWEQGTALPPHIGYPIFGEDISGGRLCSYTPRLNHDAEDARLRLSQILRESLQSDFSSQNPHVIYRHHTNETAERFFLYNNSDETQELISRWIPARNAPPAEIRLFDLVQGIHSLCPVWAPFPETEGGGVSLSLVLGPRQLRVFEMRFTEAQHHLWRANFVVETVEEHCIRGYAQETILPFCVAEQQGKTIQWTAPKVLLPAPLFIDEDELERRKSTFGGDVSVPAAWQAHRIMLEMRPEGAAVEVQCNGTNCGMIIAPPFLFDVTGAVRCGEVNHFELQFWQDGITSPGPARLVAWPEINIAK